MKKHKAFYMQVERQKTVTYVNETKRKEKKNETILLKMTKT